MNVNPESIIVNSCGYTPVYFIQNPAANQVRQARSYYITQSNHDVKPVSDNLRKFYESSGNLENSVVLKTVENNTKPINRWECNQTGNNLKLANFLLPKSDGKPQILSNNKIALKAIVNTKSLVKLDTMPQMQVERKIVKLKSNSLITKPANIKLLPKIKPNENIRNSSKYSSKHTSVQLLKLGGTYHSLNQLNDNEMKVVNQALKNLRDPEKVPPEPTYDPVSNTKFVYKIVSPKDLTVVGKNKIVIKPKKNGIKNEIVKTEQKTKEMQNEDERSEPLTEMKTTRSGRVVKSPKQIVRELSPQKSRKKSGTIVSCVQCSTDFESLYRLQKHYDNHPTHVPTKTHSNLFHCLLAIVKSGSEEDRSNIFIQQLEQLIEKLKSLLPCLLKKIDGNGGKLCTVNEDIGRLFGMNPGKYNLNMEALNCVRNKDGHCKHNPPKTNTPQFNSDLSKPSQLWLSKHNEELANNENETEDCARINSVEKLPVVGKRVLKLKQQKSQEFNAKRMKLTSENNETAIELGSEDLINFNNMNEQSSVNVQTSTTTAMSDTTQVISENKQPIKTENGTEIEQTKKVKIIPQFHSAHFDIRSSPIKPSSTVFRKIQINPQKFAKLEVPLLRPLKINNDHPQNNLSNTANEILQNNLSNTTNEILQNNLSNTTNDILQNNISNTMDEITRHNISNPSFETCQNNVTQTNSIATLDLDCILKEFKDLQPRVTTDTNHDIAFHNKDWTTSETESVTKNQYHETHQSYIKPNNLLESAIQHCKDELMNKSVESNNTKLGETDSLLTSSQNQSVLNFLDSLGNDCLAYPETEIKNGAVDLTYPESEIKNGAVDFSDLFTFNNA